jgi:hypothetical protein
VLSAFRKSFQPQILGNRRRAKRGREKKERLINMTMLGIQPTKFSFAGINLTIYRQPTLSQNSQNLNRPLALLRSDTEALHPTAHTVLESGGGTWVAVGLKN